MKCIILFMGVLAFVKGSPIAQDYKDGYVQFSANVYKELKKSKPGNFLVCPLSVETVLALAHAGANGDTATQISSALHLPEDKQAIQGIFKDLAPKLEGNGDYELSNANKIYVKHDFQLNEDFKRVAEDAFRSEVEEIDFEENTKAAKTMNKWVEEKTHDKIKDLINKDDLDSDTRLVLINALYFHGKWLKQFSEQRTAKKAFYVGGEKETKVDMMELTSKFKYYDSPELNAKFLELPYKGEGVSMTIVLPNEIDGLANLEEKIEDVLSEPKYRSVNVHVQMPKFKMETTIDFNKVLENLGITQAFQDNAEFYGIATGGVPLKISKVVQKTFIEVEEKGTTAAAATAVLVSFIRSGHVHAPPVEFNANHPFIYYLKSPAGILFVGRYTQG